VTYGIQDVALGMEKAEPNLLERPPRSPKEAIFNSVMLRRVLAGGLYMGVVAFALFYWLTLQGIPTESARNATLLLMVLFENLHVFNSRSEQVSIFGMDHRSNSLVVISVIATQILHIAAMHLPWTQHLLALEPVSFTSWLFMLLLTFGLVAIMEVEKLLRRRSLRSEAGQRP
jgi:magnesium-transporting ATPase (P-type)